MKLCLNLFFEYANYFHISFLTYTQYYQIFLQSMDLSHEFSETGESKIFFTLSIIFENFLQDDKYSSPVLYKISVSV